MVSLTQLHNGLQLLLAAATLAFTLTYPGIMVLVSGAAGLAFFLASLWASRGSRPAAWTALGFSGAAMAVAAIWIYQVYRNGYLFLEGKYAWHGEPTLSPYLLLAFFLLAAVVVAMYLPRWRWMIFGAGSGQERSEAGKPPP